jgi:hypothetical protein
MLKVAALGGIVFALCAGCATNRALNMTYLSSPEGASLYEGGRFLGYTPMTLTYQDSLTAFARNECLHLNSMHVRWASGVVASAPDLKACPNPGFSQQFVFNRPELPGADIDTNYAAQLERDPALQEQASRHDATVVAENLQGQKAH